MSDKKHPAEPDVDPDAPVVSKGLQKRDEQKKPPEPDKAA